MSDEFDTIPDSNHFSSFWPMLMVIAGLIIWFAVQDYELNRQRVIYDQQIANAMPTVNKAQVYSNRYVALMKDMVETAQKNPSAAQIVKEAMQAGWIQVQPNSTNSAGTPAAPAPAASK